MYPGVIAMVIATGHEVVKKPGVVVIIENVHQAITLANVYSVALQLNM